jgi:UDP-N-acetylmuramoyl-tripeptide--D-alanyl-D-alanine ligase
MFAGLAVLARAPGRRLAVLGHMGELGDASVEAHRQVGCEAARLGLPLITVGPQAAVMAASCRAAGGAEAEEVADVAAAVALIREHLALGPTTVLIKASRSAALEWVVQALITAHTHGRPA